MKKTKAPKPTVTLPEQWGNGDWDAIPKPVGLDSAGWAPEVAQLLQATEVALSDEALKAAGLKSKYPYGGEEVLTNDVVDAIEAVCVARLEEAGYAVVFKDSTRTRPLVELTQTTRMRRGLAEEGSSHRPLPRK